MKSEKQISQAMTSRSDLLLPSEVAKMFRISERTLSRWVAGKKFPSPFQVGGVRRWRRSDLELLIKTRGLSDA